MKNTIYIAIDVETTNDETLTNGEVELVRRSLTDNIGVALEESDYFSDGVQECLMTAELVSMKIQKPQ